MLLPSCYYWYKSNKHKVVCRADLRLLGAIRKTVSPSGITNERMKRICPCFTPPRIALAESARETCLFRGLLCFQNGFFYLEQETLQHSHYMIWLIYVERATAPHYNTFFFHSRWPNSKTKMNSSLRARGPPGFSGDVKLAKSLWQEQYLKEWQIVCVCVCVCVCACVRAWVSECQADLSSGS